MSRVAHSELAVIAGIERVLVVDDHSSFRRGARMLLADEGFEVVGEAEDGAAALALADDLEPDLVLLDVQLPDFDGFEVASRLLRRRPWLAIVLVSTRDHDDYGSLVEDSARSASSARPTSPAQLWRACSGHRTHSLCYREILTRAPGRSAPDRVVHGANAYEIELLIRSRLGGVRGYGKTAVYDTRSSSRRSGTSRRSRSARGRRP